MIQSTQNLRTEGTRFPESSLFNEKSKRSVIQRACSVVPAFRNQLLKFEQQIALGSYSKATLIQYARSVSQVTFYFKKSPLDLDQQEIDSYLHCMTVQNASQTAFKHAIHGLRFFFRMYDREDSALKLPSIKEEKRLPVVLSKEELKRLFTVPKRQKQRVIFCLIYSAGLRISELCNLKISDIDFDRKQIRIRQSKGNKDRYIILSDYIAIGIRKHILGAKPIDYLFNGRIKGTPLGVSTVQKSFRLALQYAQINKEATVHTLRHSFATHMLEDGVDILTIKELLGHAHIETTMIYLHVARIPRKEVKSPLDTLYPRA